jgi:hypothetical protein
MYFKLNTIQENSLLQQPETGMGYQIFEASKTGSYKRERFLALNSQIIIELNGFEGDHVRKIINEGILNVRAIAKEITLTGINVLNNIQYRQLVGESKNEHERGAIDNPVEQANGEEIFVRLSAFDNDRRIDKINKRLLPGSFTTMADDFSYCKSKSIDPIERYALPNNDVIKFVFYIKPLKNDTLQRGIVQPANGKQGGGKEAYFNEGTSNGTFFLQTPY